MRRDEVGSNHDRRVEMRIEKMGKASVETMSIKIGPPPESTTLPQFIV
jgi:hypothetical protein